MAKVRFAAEFPGAQRVYLAGDFNGWRADARRMRRARKGEDVFVAALDLAPGRHEFKYVVDGEWRCCSQSARATSDLWTENCVVEVEG